MSKGYKEKKISDIGWENKERKKIGMEMRIIMIMIIIAFVIGQEVAFSGLYNYLGRGSSITS